MILWTITSAPGLKSKLTWYPWRVRRAPFITHRIIEWFLKGHLVPTPLLQSFSMTPAHLDTQRGKRSDGSLSTWTTSGHVVTGAWTVSWGHGCKLLEVTSCCKAAWALKNLEKQLFTLSPMENGGKYGQLQRLWHCLPGLSEVRLGRKSWIEPTGKREGAGTGRLGWEWRGIWCERDGVQELLLCYKFAHFLIFFSAFFFFFTVIMFQEPPEPETLPGGWCILSCPLTLWWYLSSSALW